MKACVRRVTFLRLWDAVKTLVESEKPEVWFDELARQWQDELDEDAASVDMSGWITWLVAGISLFSKGKPLTMHETSAAVERIILRLAMEQHAGTITYMAESLGTSRRLVREHLKQVGLYEEAKARHRAKRARRRRRRVDEDGVTDVPAADDSSSGTDRPRATLHVVDPIRAVDESGVSGGASSVVRLGARRGGKPS